MWDFIDLCSNNATDELIDVDISKNQSGINSQLFTYLSFNGAALCVTGCVDYF